MTPTDAMREAEAGSRCMGAPCTCPSPTGADKPWHSRSVVDSDLLIAAEALLANAFVHGDTVKVRAVAESTFVDLRAAVRKAVAQPSGSILIKLRRRSDAERADYLSAQLLERDAKVAQMTKERDAEVARLKALVHSLSQRLIGLVDFACGRPVVFVEKPSELPSLLQAAEAAVAEAWFIPTQAVIDLKFAIDCHKRKESARG